MSSLVPEPITQHAGQVDGVHIYLFIVMGFWFVACNAAMVYFALRYRRKKPGQKAISTVHHHNGLEVLWTAIPTIIVLFTFGYSTKVWYEMRTPPEDAMEIRVRGQKWSWSFQYENGRTTAGDLYIPKGVPVKLNMKSQDVVHSLFIPRFRYKEDVVPNVFTYMWFKADKVGEFPIFCAEYCGDQHSQMLGTVHVLDEASWERFQNNEPLDPNAAPLTPVEHGEDLFVKRGCLGCHSTDGTAGIGPTFKGLYGKKEVLADGTTVDVEDNYLMESIYRPNVKLVAGYNAGLMPAFEGQLTDDDVADLITYIKTLK